MSDINEFYLQRYKTKTTVELQNILASRASFTPEAIKVAEYVLKERVNGNEEFQEPKPIFLDEEKKSNNPSKGLFDRVNTSLKSVAIYQIISSLIALQYVFGLSFASIIDAVFLILFLIVYLSGLIGGILLFRLNSKGILLSKINHVFQTLSIGIGGFFFYSDALFTIYLKLVIQNGFNFEFGFETMPGMAFQFYEGNLIQIGINFAAIIALSILFHAENLISQNQEFSTKLFEKNLLKEENHPNV